MNKIYVKAMAKINLTLNVLNKREDGYHELKSIMKKINLYDELYIEKNDSNDINIKRPYNTGVVLQGQDFMYDVYGNGSFELFFYRMHRLTVDILYNQRKWTIQI